MENNKQTKPFNDWKIKELGEIGKFSKGKGILKEQVLTNGLPCIRYGEIYTTHHYVIDKIQSFINEDVAKESQEIKKGDILFAGSGETIEEIGKAVVYLKDEKAYAGGDVIIFSGNEKVNTECLTYILELDFVKKQKRRFGQGNAIVHIYPSDLAKLQIPLPPLSEQKAIAHVLSLMDSLISKTQALLAQKEAQKKGLMQLLLTGKKRLMGFGGEWKEYSLGEIFDRVTRKNTEKNSNVVTISAQRGFIKQTDFFSKTIASEILDNYFLVEKGEFCYNKSYANGYPWGATKRLNDYEKAVVTTLYICFGIKNHHNNSGDFFEQFFAANLLDKGLMKIAHEGGRAHGLLNVTPSDFFSLKIAIPSLEEQTAIAQVLQTADREIAILKSKLERQKEQKKGMMQVLLTGKKRLYH